MVCKIWKNVRMIRPSPRSVSCQQRSSLQGTPWRAPWSLILQHRTGWLTAALGDETLEQDMAVPYAIGHEYFEGSRYCRRHDKAHLKHAGAACRTVQETCRESRANAAAQSLQPPAPQPLHSNTRLSDGRCTKSDSAPGKQRSVQTQYTSTTAFSL